MTKQVLLIHNNSDDLGYWQEAMSQVGDFAVTAVTTLTEACLHLVQHHYDLAFIPHAQDGQAIRLLHTLQEDIAVMMITDAPQTLPPSLLNQLQGVLVRPSSPSGWITAVQNVFSPPPDPDFDAHALQKILAAAQLDWYVQTAVLSYRSHLITHWGKLNESEAHTVAQHIGGEWGHSAQTTRLQTIRWPNRGSFLLYTSATAIQETAPTPNGPFLTLVANINTPLGLLRQERDRLTRLLSGESVSEPSLAAGKNSYAILWRAVRPLPDLMQVPLRRALERIANQNGCQLSYIAIFPEVVHLVIACPSGRDGRWVAELLQSGSQESIQQAYGVSTKLWQTGYYVAPALVPFSDEQLQALRQKESPDTILTP